MCDLRRRWQHERRAWAGRPGFTLGIAVPRRTRLAASCPAVTALLFHAPPTTTVKYPSRFHTHTKKSLNNTGIAGYSLLRTSDELIVIVRYIVLRKNGNSKSKKRVWTSENQTEVLPNLNSRSERCDESKDQVASCALLAGLDTLNSRFDDGNECNITWYVDGMNMCTGSSN